jgi:hypothetical protein
VVVRGVQATITVETEKKNPLGTEKENPAGVALVHDTLAKHDVDSTS